MLRNKPMDVTQYLERIAYRGPLSPTLTVLQQLQRHHIMRVPFENLDIHHGNKIELNIEKVFDKVVNRNRGGFCYELNGLFHELLRSIGFEVKRISARVYVEEKGYGFEFDHLANIVTLHGTDYLTDIGFGSFTYGPLTLEFHREQEDEMGTFRIQEDEKPYLRVEQKIEGKWVPQYIFSLIERSYSDYAEMCQYHQTSPDSHFVQNKLCTLATETGRYTLSGDKIKITESGTKKEVSIRSEEEYYTSLKQFFGIEL